MKPSRIFSVAKSVILAFGIILIVPGFSHSASLRLEKYDGGIFTISKPEGWEVITAGQCSTFAFLLKDPSSPLRQVFHFGEVEK